MWHGLIRIDEMLFNYINHNLANPIFDILMPVLTWFGNVGSVWIFMGLIAFLLGGKKGRQVAVMLFIAAILSDLTTEVALKKLIMRPRPFEALNHVRTLVARPGSSSFPSGHAAVSFTAAMVMAYNYKKFAGLFFLLAFGIAFSRIYVGVHFPLDVLGGIVIGLILGSILVARQSRILNLIDRARKKYFRREKI